MCHSFLCCFSKHSIPPSGTKRINRPVKLTGRFFAVPRRGASYYMILGAMLLWHSGCCPPQGRELLRWVKYGASVSARCCPPQGRELLLEIFSLLEYRRHMLLSPAGARVVTSCSDGTRGPGGCCPPQGRELLRHERAKRENGDKVAVPRRGASCYYPTQYVRHPFRGCCPPQGRELLLCDVILRRFIYEVAVPRRGASCYMFGIKYNTYWRMKLLSPAGA